MLRVSNIAHLPTKPDQVAKAGRLGRENQTKQASSIKFAKTKEKTK